MSKKLNSIVGYIYYMIILVTLVLPIIYPNLTKLLNISLVMLWIVSISIFTFTMITFIGAVLLDKDELKEMKESFEQVPKTTLIARLIAILKVLVVLLLAAYNNLIVTAITHLFCCYFMILGYYITKSIVNQRIEEEFKSDK